MKTKVKTLPYEQVLALPRPRPKAPRRPSWLLGAAIRLISAGELRSVGFSASYRDMDKIGPKEPVLILMNHSCFLDLQIANKLFFPRPYSIVCTSDGFVGKEALMRALGCIPTRKFVTDLGLVRDMDTMLHKKHISVLMFPEASYSFDGTATPLPRKMGVLLKKLNVPVVTVITHGAFLRDPLYNMLQKRKVQVRAEVSCLFTPAEIQEKSVPELDAALDKVFSFDNFREQEENHIAVTEPFRANGLQRVLYQCPHCGREGHMEGKGTTLTCHACGKTYELTPTGYLKAQEGDTEFPHIPDWYAWERENVRKSLLDGSYLLDIPVKIAMMVDYKAIYRVGEGRLRHDANGFRLTGCDGKLDYSQPPLASYGLYADYFWYELGDIICIGNQDVLYYCFPQGGDVVAKTRLAAEELYKLKKQGRKRMNPDLDGSK